MEVKKGDLKLILPFRGLISGSSGAGKTSFILRFLENRTEICQENFQKVIYCCSMYSEHNLTEKDKEVYQSLRKAVPYIEFYSTVPDLEELSENKSIHTLLILEDMIQEIVSSEKFSKLYTRISSHSNISVITTSQNYFEQGKHSQTIIRNQTFYVIFQSKGDNQTLSLISSRMFTTSKHFLQKCFGWLNKMGVAGYKKYLFINVNPSTELPQNFPMVQTNMFKESPFFSPVYFDEK